MLDLYAALRDPKSRDELRRNAYDCCLVASEISRPLGGAVSAVAMNHLANQAFYAWNVLDIHACLDGIFMINFYLHHLLFLSSVCIYSFHKSFICI